MKHQIFKSMSKKTILIIFIFTLTASINFWLSGTIFRETFNGDGGYYNTIARNMIHSANYILNPSSTPLGEADPLISMHPPTNSLFRAGGLILFNGHVNGSLFVSFLGYLLLLFFSYKFTELFNQKAALWTLVFLSISPTLMKHYISFEADPLLCSVGMGAIYFYQKGIQLHNKRDALLAGLCLGVGFLLKLYLILPFVCVFIAITLLELLRAQCISKKTMKFISLTITAFIVTGSLQLLVLAIFSIQEFLAWLTTVYFPFFQQSLLNSKINVNILHPEWNHPFWYYPVIVYRDHFFLMPVILLSGFSVYKYSSNKQKRGLLAILSGILSISILTIPSVKEPLYILGGIILIYILAGLCIQHYLDTISENTKLELVLKLIITPLLLLLIGGVLFAYFNKIKSDDITTLYAIQHTIILMAIGGFILISKFIRQKKGVLLLVCFVVFNGLFVFNLSKQHPLHKPISTIIAPYIDHIHPSKISFLHDPPHALTSYLFQRGAYWREITISQTKEGPVFTKNGIHQPQIRAVVITPKQLSNPKFNAIIQFVEKNWINKTSDLSEYYQKSNQYRIYVKN